MQEMNGHREWCYFQTNVTQEKPMSDGLFLWLLIEWDIEVFTQAMDLELHDDNDHGRIGLSIRSPRTYN